MWVLSPFLHKFKSTPVAAAAVGEAVAAEVAVAPEAAEEEEAADSRRRRDVLPAPRPGQARRPPAPVLQQRGLVPVLDPARQPQVLVRPLVLVPRRVRPVLGPVALMSRGAAVPRLAR